MATQTTTTTGATTSKIAHETHNRANRIAIRNNPDGSMTAAYFRTHAELAHIDSTAGWTAPTGRTTPTAMRESFRAWAIEHAEDAGVWWGPEYQTQSWERRYWKYETDAQVEEDARTLMAWTIERTCEKCKYRAVVDSIVLDSIVPNESPLSYVEDGRYTKTGNWAVATVNLEVNCTIEDTPVSVVWAIEMRSGQLTKIKMTKADIEQMIADSGIQTA